MMVEMWEISYLGVCLLVGWLILFVFAGIGLMVSKSSNSTRCVVYGGVCEVLVLEKIFGERRVRWRDGRDAV